MVTPCTLQDMRRLTAFGVTMLESLTRRTPQFS